MSSAVLDLYFKKLVMCQKLWIAIVLCILIVLNKMRTMGVKKNPRGGS